MTQSMTENEAVSLDYLAGLIDGEGTITLLRCDNSPFRQIVVSIQMCDEALIRLLQESFGGTVTKRAYVKANHSIAWTWKVTHRRALRLLQRVCPYLRLATKKTRALYIVNGYESVVRRNGKYGETDKKRRLDFESSFFLLTPSRMSPTFPTSSFEELMIA